MIEKFLNNRLFIVFIIPFTLGAIGVLSFSPFNITLINFFIIPGLFLLVSFVNKKSKSIYRRRPYLRNLFFIKGCFANNFESKPNFSALARASSVVPVLSVSFLKLINFSSLINFWLMG